MVERVTGCRRPDWRDRRPGFALKRNLHALRQSRVEGEAQPWIVGVRQENRAERYAGQG